MQANIDITDFPSGPITKHFKWEDFRCHGYEKDPCRAIPPDKAIYNLEVVLFTLAEPYIEFLKGYRIPRSPKILNSYVCPRCSGRRELYSWDPHRSGRAVDLMFGSLRPINSSNLYSIAIEWQVETGVQCSYFPHYTCLHLELDPSVGYMRPLFPNDSQ